MADGTTSEILIVVKPTGAATALIGEARAVIDITDTEMMGGFEGSGANPQYGAAEEFQIGIRIEDRDMSTSGSGGEDGAGGGDDMPIENKLHDSGAPQQTLLSEPGATPSPGLAGAPEVASGAKAHKKYQGFIDDISVWDETNGFGYGCDLEEVTISRKVDCMSLELLELCGKQQAIDYIIVVRRKPVGTSRGGSTSNSGPKEFKAYLRYKFSEVLLTGVEWEDGEVVKEKVKFIYRTIETKYKPQQDDGSLAASIGADYEYPIGNA